GQVPRRGRCDSSTASPWRYLLPGAALIHGGGRSTPRRIQSVHRQQRQDSPCLFAQEQLASDTRQNSLHRFEVQAAASDVGRLAICLVDRLKPGALTLRTVHTIQAVALRLEDGLLRFSLGAG